MANLLWTLLTIIILAILGVCSGYIVKFLNEKTEAVKQEYGNKSVNTICDFLREIIYDSVIATNQTYVNTLKQKGSFDLSAQKEAFSKTYDAVVSVLTDDSKEIIGKYIGNLDVYITNMIETIVHEQKGSAK